MAQTVFGFQILLIGVFGAGLVHELTGANFWVSVIVGFIGGSGLFGVAFGLMPKVMFYGLVAIYAIIGGWVAQYLGWGAGETFVLALFAGGVGWAANFTFAQDAYLNRQDHENVAERDAADPAQRTKNKAADKKDLLPEKSVMKVEDRADLLDEAALAYGSGLVPREIYERMCGEIQRLADGQKRQDQPVPADRISPKGYGPVGGDERMALVNLYELRLIRGSEWEEIGELMDAEPLEAAGPKSGYAIHAHSLFRLAECRAITLDTFLRAMLKIDPDYPPQAAKLQNFPLCDPESDAREQATALFQDNLINLEEYQKAIDVIEQKQGVS